MAFYNCTCDIERPVDCSSFALPDVLFQTCAAAYNAHESEITDIWLVETTDGIANSLPVTWYDTADWDTTGFTGAQHLTVIGDKPLSAVSEIIVARKWVKTTRRTHTLNADITDMPLENYNFIRAVQLQPTIAMWFKTMDGYIFGGANGVVADVKNAGNILGRGDGTLLTGQMEIEWDCDCDPEGAIDGIAPTP